MLERGWRNQSTRIQGCFSLKDEDMDRRYKLIAFRLIFALMASGWLYAAFADDNSYRKNSQYQKRERRHSIKNNRRNLPIVSEPAYKKNCGACHFAYQPGLLPSDSWEKILTRLSDHFGESIDLDPESEKTIMAYLKDNSANNSSRIMSVKIMQSLKNQTPLRITDVPYIQREHHEIQQSVLNLESIGSLSNCAACHTTAEVGIYNDDHVTIPR